MGDYAQRDWERVGARLQERMNELSMLKSDLVAASGVTLKSLNPYLRGTPIVRRDKKWALCRALGWTRDSIDLILEGKDPILLAPVGMSDPDEDLRESVRQLEVRFDRLESLVQAWRAETPTDRPSGATQPG